MVQKLSLPSGQLLSMGSGTACAVVASGGSAMPNKLAVAGQKVTDDSGTSSSDLYQDPIPSF